MKDKPQKPEDVKVKIKYLLAGHLGVEPEDINDDDLLVEDLHMGLHGMSDFVHSLVLEGLDASDIDLSQVETVEELIETILAKSDII